ncbi:protein CHUP1, chloroplastic [Andrographis paniculata]|uniref:protein CHUP1, chloroplastic n=1 Tax=Andrographis paniculata TaxID=175694 RepID=UPI0021E7CEFB|nr:protein CHUP1, chloroplastic [Andrographis paniculata]
MVAGKVKSAMGLQKSQGSTKLKTEVSSKPPLLSTPSSAKQQQQVQKGSGAPLSRSFGVYFPRASAQVQPRPPDVSELLRLVEELRESESRLKTELLEQKLLRESVAIVPVLENVISNKDAEIERSRKKIECLDSENERLREENEFLHMELSKQNHKYEEKIKQMQAELSDIKRAVEESERENEEEEEEDEEAASNASAIAAKLNDKHSVTVASKCSTKCVTTVDGAGAGVDLKKDELISAGDAGDGTSHSRSNSGEILETSDVLTGIRSRIPRVPKPPPRPISAPSLSGSASHAPADILAVPAPPPPPPPPPPFKSSSSPRTLPLSRRGSSTAPCPPPPPPQKGCKPIPAKVTRVPEVVEFYHSLMKRDINGRRDASGGGADAQGGGAATAKDMIGEIENRSAHLLAIKTDVETQGDFIKFLIKEVEAAAFTDIEDVVPFVKWLDDELSYLVDERAVLKHFDWPEKKADALREAAFEYCDLKKLETEVSSFRDDPRQPCGHALKKMQSLYEKLEHGVHNLSRMRESAAERYRGFKIPINWMLDTGYISQIKLASVKLAMKYMKRVSAELELAAGGPEEEELIVHGVKFAFRVHQFAGGFDVETMRAFQELRDKSRAFNPQHQHKIVCRSSSCC